MHNQHLTFNVGECTVAKVMERELQIPAGNLFPGFIHSGDPLHGQPVPLSIHSWLIHTPDDVIVIDTGTGNGRDRGNNPLYDHISSPYQDNFLATGVKPEEVTLVLLTHLHTDHVGWNTVEDNDRWVPMFPNARYICSAKELERVKHMERYRNLWLDSLLPIIEAGLLETIDVAAEPVFGNTIKYIPTPGHSPDHASLIISSGGEYGLFTGDLMHSPLQLAHPEWNSVFCHDHQQAESSRRKAITWCQQNNALWFSAHFAGESCARLTQDKTGQLRWLAV